MSEEDDGGEGWRQKTKDLVLFMTAVDWLRKYVMELINFLSQHQETIERLVRAILSILGLLALIGLIRRHSEPN